MSIVVFLVLTSCRWLPTFRRNVLPLSSGLNDSFDTYLKGCTIFV
jgi:hypothetical protein